MRASTVIPVRQKLTDFIFDDLEGMENKALRMYAAVKTHFPERQFGRIARSDRQMIALQAADLVAWQIRRFRSMPGEPLRNEFLRLQSCRRPSFRSTITKQDLHHRADVTIANIPNLREELAMDESIAFYREERSEIDEEAFQGNQ